MRVGFRIRTPSVARASIIWLAHAVKVVRPAARRLHLDCVRSAKGWHLGNTLGVCMSGLGNLVMLADNGEMMSVLLSSAANNTPFAALLNGKRFVKRAALFETEGTNRLVICLV
jgi:hypothetical protein